VIERPELSLRIEVVLPRALHEHLCVSASLREPFSSYSSSSSSSSSSRLRGFA
jgi:hypothetical protein